MQPNKNLLSRLSSSGLEFVVVGDTCCVYHGATLATYTLALCCRLDNGDLQKIEAALQDVHPYHRMTSDKLPFRLSPELNGKLTSLHLGTDLGPLDCLSEVCGVGVYDAVRRESETATVSLGEFRFLSLDALIRAKQAAGSEWDLATVRELKVNRNF